MDYTLSKPKKILLILPSYASVRKGTIFQMGTHPSSLSMATIVGTLFNHGHNVRIFDLNKHNQKTL